jgi:hypothetical protein
MAAASVADQMVETLSAAGVQRIYGIVGDIPNGFTGGIAKMAKGFTHDMLKAVMSGRGNEILARPNLRR